MKKFTMCALTLVTCLAVLSASALAVDPVSRAPRGTVLTPPLEAQDVLWDQTGNCGAGITSQEFGAANDIFTAQAADDFELASGFSYAIDSVSAPGALSIGVPVAIVNVQIYNKDAGGIPGTLECNYDGIAASDDGNGNLTIDLPTDCVVKGGQYWVSVQADVDFGSGGQWFWNTQPILTNNEATWQNPGNGFGTGCTSWATLFSCLGAGPDMCFSISGTATPQGGIGACCNDGTGECADGVEFDDCQGANERWSLDTLCADLDPICEPARGACCDLVDETCTNDVFNADCSGNNQVWFIDEDCAGCDEDPGLIHIEILTDNFAGETSWELSDSCTGDLVATGDPDDNATLFTWDIDVSGCGCYQWTIFDSFGDGICCGFGIGSYSVSYNGDEVCSGGDFGSSETCSDIGTCTCEGTAVCPDAATGACCNFDGSCIDAATQAECDDFGINGGDWFKGGTCPQPGHDPLATDISCEAIPTVSEWGLVVMVLLGCTLGTILYGRRRAARTA